MHIIYNQDRVLNKKASWALIQPIYLNIFYKAT